MDRRLVRPVAWRGPPWPGMRDAFDRANGPPPDADHLWEPWNADGSPEWGVEISVGKLRLTETGAHGCYWPERVRTPVRMGAQIGWPWYDPWPAPEYSWYMQLRTSSSGGLWTGSKWILSASLSVKPLTDPNNKYTVHLRVVHDGEMNHSETEDLGVPSPWEPLVLSANRAGQIRLGYEAGEFGLVEMEHELGEDPGALYLCFALETTDPDALTWGKLDIVNAYRGEISFG